MKIELSDVSESEMFNFVSDVANGLKLTEEQSDDFGRVLRDYGFNICVLKSNSDYFQVWKG